MSPNVGVNICMEFHEDTLKILKLQRGHDFVSETATYKGTLLKKYQYKSYVS